MVRSILVGAAMTAVLTASTVWAAEPAGPKQDVKPGKHRVIVRAIEGRPGATIVIEAGSDNPEAAPGEPTVKVFSIDSSVKIGDRWLGLECYPVEGALRAQLKLAEGQGLVIEDVAPDSPAAKAGLRKHDVLVKAGGKPVGRIEQLIEAVDAAKDKKLSLEIIREGKPRRIDATPAKRPAAARLHGQGFPLPVPGNPDVEVIRKWLEHVRPGEGAGGPKRFRFLQPGIILPPGAPVHPTLPGNMSVAVARQGGGPAKIVVQKDGKKWEVTEKELDKLPKDVRFHVERMLGRIPRAKAGNIDIRVDAMPLQPGVAIPRARVIPGPNRRLEKQVEKLNRQMEEMRKAIDEMRGKGPKVRKPKKPGKEAVKPAIKKTK